MSSTMCKSSFLQDKELCQSCNIYIHRQCKPNLGCKLCQFIKALYLLDFQYTQKVLSELNPWRTCPKHLSPFQFFNSTTQTMSCAECTLEIIKKQEVNFQEELKQFELVDKLAVINPEQIKEELYISPPNFTILSSVLDQLNKLKFEEEKQQNQDAQEKEKDRVKKELSFKEYTELVDNYCEQSNLIRFQSTYGHCQTNKINCIKLGLITNASRQEMSPHFQENHFNDLINKIKYK